MIGQPLNDIACLSKFSKVASDAVEKDEVRTLAKRFLETADYEVEPALAGAQQWLRTKPQRNDSGQGPEPRVDCGNVKQRVDYLGREPNCVERSIAYVAIAEHIDPDTLRQLATIATPEGLHTFPVENGQRPVVLDPTVARNSLRAGIWSMRNGQGGQARAFKPDELVSWVLYLADGEAAATRNGRSRVANAERSLERLWAGGTLASSPCAVRNSVADIAWTFALAEQAARVAGGHGIDAVRVASMGVQRLLQNQGQAASSSQVRNLSFSVGGRKFKINFGSGAKRVGRAAERLAKRVVKTAAPVGGSALAAYLLSQGVPPQAVGLVTKTIADETGLGLGGLASLGSVALSGPGPLTLDAFVSKDTQNDLLKKLAAATGAAGKPAEQKQPEKKNKEVR